MATFQEWWDENYGEFSGQSVQSKIKMRMAYDVGVEHQLTKVDKQQKRIDELQAKLDACQKLLEKWKTTGLKGASDYAVGGAHTRQECEDELEQALKGGEV